MRRALIGVTTSAVLVLMVSTISIAQQPQSAPEPPDIVHEKIFQEAAPPPLPPNFLFVSSEVGFGGKVVKGAPYSAEAVTETIQTLGDGNRIVNKTTSLLYRDSEGRTRREQALRAIGGFASGVEPIQTIFISDPVADVSYSLDSRNNVAYKTMPLKLEQKLFPAGTPAVGTEPLMQKFEYKIELKKGGPSGAGGAVTAAPVPGQEGEQFTIRTDSGGVGYVMTRRKTGDDPNAVKESLGKQTVEGVEADGTRVTITIPAGEIGNDRPIQVVSEHWYSSQLQVIVMSRHSDPRVGETTYRLTNINRTEPAKTLFEVPAGYTVSEGLPGLFKQAPVTVKKKMANPE